MYVKSTISQLDHIPVLFVYAKNSAQGGKKAFDKLESKLSSMKHRKFYGVLEGSPENGIFRACTEIMDTDNPKQLGLEIWTIPGGKYARRKIKNWLDNLHQIKPTFDEMKKEYVCDSSRPTIEFYYRENILYLYLPIK